MIGASYCDCNTFGKCSKYCVCDCHKVKISIGQPIVQSPKKVVVLGYGAGAIADYPWHLDGSQKWTEADQERALKTLQATQEAECWTIDTASRYGAGESENLVGRYLQTLPIPVEQKYFVITKVNLGSVSEMYSTFRGSIHRLGRIPQALLLHNPDFGKADDVEAACEWLTQDVKAMGVKFLGISTEPTREAEKYFKNYRDLNVIQYPFSAMDRRAHVSIFPWVNSYQWILKIANRTLGGPTKNSVPDVDECLDYVVAHKDFVDVALIGTTNPKHILEAKKVLDNVNGYYSRGGL